MSDILTSDNTLEQELASAEQIAALAQEQQKRTGITDTSNFTIMQIMRVLAKSIKEFKNASILTPILVFIETVFEVLIPFRTADLVDTLRAGADVAAIMNSGAILALMALCSLIAGGAAGLACAHASTGFARNLRRDMFYNIQTFSFTTIDSFSTSSLVTRLTTDITNVQMAYMMIIRMAIRAPFMLLFSFIAALIMGGWMAFIFAAMMPLLGIALYILITKVIPIFKRVFKQYDALNESAEENLAGIRVVKSFVNEDFERQKFDRASKDLQAGFTKAERIIALNSPFMNFSIYVVFVAILYVGSFLIISTQGSALGVGQLSSLITYGFMMLMSLMMLSFILAMIIIAEEGARRICEVLRQADHYKSRNCPHGSDRRKH